MTTVYIGEVLLEERDLIKLFGDEYRQYKNRVSVVISLRKSI